MTHEEQQVFQLKANRAITTAALRINAELTKLEDLAKSVNVPALAGQLIQLAQQKVQYLRSGNPEVIDGTNLVTEIPEPEIKKDENEEVKFEA